MTAKMTKRLKLKHLPNLKLPVIWLNWAFKCALRPEILSDLRVARSTGSRAGAGCAELGQRTGEQVYMLEKRHRWKKSMRRKPHLVNPPLLFFAACGGGQRVRTVRNLLGLMRSTHCCWRATLRGRRRAAALWGRTRPCVGSSGTHTAAADTDAPPDYCY